VPKKVTNNSIEPLRRLEY